MERRDEIAELLIPHIPEGKPLAELVHGGEELDLTVANQTKDLVPANLVTAGSWVVDVFAIVTEECAMDSTAAVVTIYEDAGTPTSLGTITFVDADPIGDFRLRTALAGGDAVHPAAGNKKYYAKVTTAAADAGTAGGKAKVYMRWIRA
jgi:hypothetical protein